MDNDEFLLLLQAKLDEAKSKGNINADIVKIQNSINHLKLQTEIDSNAISKIVSQIESVIGQKIVVGNIQINSNGVSNNSKQVGRTIGNDINQEVSNALNLDPIIDNEVQKLMNYFGIAGKKGSKAFEEIRQTVVNFRNELASANTMFVDSSLIDKATSAIVDRIKIIDKTKDAYSSLYEHIKAVNKSGEKIFLPQSIKNEYGNDFASMRSQLGPSFITTGNGTDFEVWVMELNNELGNLIDLSHGAEYAFGDLVEKLRVAKGSHFVSGKELFDYGILDKTEVEDKIVSTILSIDAQEERLKQSSTTTTNTVVQNEEKKQQVLQETAQIQKRISKNDSIIKTNQNVVTFEQSNNAARKASEYFSELLKDENAVIAVSERFGSLNGLTSFSLNIKRASGEVESLRYALEEIKDINGNGTGKFVFASQGGVINDPGAMKEVQKVKNSFADFTQKISQFKSTYNGILSGLSSPLSDFENKLSGLKNGTVTIDELRNSFKQLETAASDIVKNLGRKLSPIDASLNNLAKGEQTISGLRAELKGLNNTPKELNSELSRCAQLLENVKTIESNQGRTESWSAAYKEWAASVDNLTAKIRTLKKEQSNAASSQIFNISDLLDNKIPYMSKVYNTIDKQYDAIGKMGKRFGFDIVKVSGIEKIDGKISKLTLTVRTAEGALKKFDMQREKLQGTGKAQYGLVQVGDVRTLETASEAQEKLYASSQKELKTLSVFKSTWEKQGILVGEFKTKIEQLETSLSNVGSHEELDTLRGQLETIKSEAEQLADASKITGLLNNGGYESKVADLEAKFKKLGLTEDEVALKMRSVKEAFQALSSSNLSQEELIQREREFNLALDATQNHLTILKAEMREYATANQTINLTNKIEKWLQNNTRATKECRQELNLYLKELQSGQVTSSRYKEIGGRLTQIDTEMRSLGKLGKSFTNTFVEGMKKFSYWTSSTFLVMKAISEIRKAVSSVVALDTALVDLRKTANMTAKELEDFYYDSNETAKQMGVTTEEIINQAAAWSRLGYSTNEQATKMAKYSAMFKMISPGMDIDASTDGLVSVMKAFKIGAEDVDEVVDGIMSKINIIGNTRAVSNSDIVDILTRTSSAMAEANNTLEETIALGTAATEITRDATSVGNALKTISMRIRSYDEETESYSEDLENISGKIADLTKTASSPGGISLFTDSSKTEYKSTYQILKDISDVYDEISDKDQADLLEALAGKRQGQIIAAILNNFEAVEDSLNSMANSAGNAEAEIAIAMDSVSFKYNKLKETGTGIAQNLFNRDDMKSLLSFFTSFAEKIDFVTSKLGLFGSIGLGAGLFTGIKNVGGDKKYSLICSG